MSDGTGVRGYWQRVASFYRVLNPLNLLVPDDVVTNLHRQKATHSLTAQQEALVASAIHPATGALIPRPWRVAAIVPMNVPIVAGILLTTPTIPNIVAWQVLNQAYNFAVNQANSSTNSGANTPWVPFVGAVGVSVAVAVGLERLARRCGSRAVSLAAPVVAVALAGVANVGLCRWGELVGGIPTYDPSTGELVDQASTSASWRALSQVATTRVCTSLGVLAAPQLLCSLVPRMGPGARMAAIVGSLQVCLPMSLALFPQRGTFRDPESGRAVVFNKGL